MKIAGIVLVSGLALSVAAFGAHAQSSSGGSSSSSGSSAGSSSSGNSGSAGSTSRPGSSGLRSSFGQRDSGGTTSSSTGSDSASSSSSRSSTPLGATGRPDGSLGQPGRTMGQPTTGIGAPSSTRRDTTSTESDQAGSRTDPNQVPSPLRDQPDSTKQQFLGSGGKAPDGSVPGGALVALTEQERAQIREIILSQRVAQEPRTNFKLTIGAKIPANVSLRPLPQEVVNLVPKFKEFDFTIANDRIVIVQRSTREIDSLIPI
jgi:hypothetical protein